LREAGSSPWAVLGALQALTAPRRSGSRVTYRVADPAGNRETEKLRVRLK